MSSEETNSDDYTTVRLPKEIMDEIDQIIKRGIRGYKSRAEFIKEAIRKRFEELQHCTAHAKAAATGTL